MTIVIDHVNVWPIEVLLSPAELSFVYTLAAQRYACKPANDRFLSKKLSAYGSHVVGEIIKQYGGK